MTDRDLFVISRVLIPLNLIATGAGFYLYFYGLEALYPKNAVTELMYRSILGVGGESWNRIPATFMSAHAYGGTMMATLPLLMGGMMARPHAWERLAFVLGIVAACIGILMCGGSSAGCDSRTYVGYHLDRKRVSCKTRHAFGSCRRIVSVARHREPSVSTRARNAGHPTSLRPGLHEHERIVPRSLGGIPHGGGDGQFDRNEFAIFPSRSGTKAHRYGE